MTEVTYLRQILAYLEDNDIAGKMDDILDWLSRISSSVEQFLPFGVLSLLVYIGFKSVRRRWIEF